jgi:hypothetical protein
VATAATQASAKIAKKRIGFKQGVPAHKRSQRMKRSWLALAALLHAVLGVTPSVKLEVINQSPQKLGIFVGSHKAHYVSPYSIGVFGVLKGIPFKVYFV